MKINTPVPNSTYPKVAQDVRKRTFVFQTNFGAYRQFNVSKRHLRVAAKRQVVKKLILYFKLKKQLLKFYYNYFIDL
jgi:hypothetical protein